MGKQFANVSARYGAPMGRRSVPDLDTTRGTVRLFSVKLDSGGYDDGGAYWGTNRPGERLYCAIDHAGDMQFIRSTSREMACYLLDIPAPALARGFDWRAWADRMARAGEPIAGWMHECEVVESE
jgi:hypothetical protein